ncbi:amino acid/amide ABC transporter membrane protein 1 (HAAT family) [Nonomuraea polychroma]|uniref:Amino acid/amide ABC transporter membrane protein 1 (HAAT family) n=1 Tax=Nonomuraea polychroma TaxID=46176 RepID=A0A438M245_9ACTN|nr:branched-chain amino acid ABC transporter permease [Nonomuraea polychroma]RVX39593.1 amino acid/amide ABC transporter membrane protein 1 (HAAT family) [Nonomuraea polychroma]
MRRAVIAFTAFLGGLVFLLAGPAHAGPADCQGLRGTLKLQGQPVNGAKIAVTTESGQPVKEVTTNAQGTWDVQVEDPGKYKVTLDVASLPQNAEVRGGNNVRTPTVYEDNCSTVLFALQPKAAPGQQQESTGGSTFWQQAAQLTFEGLNLGLIIALGALGLSLIYGTTGLTNFAHGELITLGAVLAYAFNIGFSIQLIPAAVIAVIAAGALGYGQDRLFWGQLRKRGTGTIAMMIISIGVAILLRNLIQFFFGPQTENFNDYVSQAGISVGPITAAPKNFWAMGIELAVLVVVGIALMKTRTGKAARAVADNPALAASSGINVDRVIRIIWTAGAAIAALAGIMLGLSQSLKFTMGQDILLLIFAGVTLGGLGTAFGALVGSLVVGVFIQVSTLWVPPELKSVGALAVLIIVLLFRPQGILGRRERIG